MTLRDALCMMNMVLQMSRDMPVVAVIKESYDSFFRDFDGFDSFFGGHGGFRFNFNNHREHTRKSPEEEINKKYFN